MKASKKMHSKSYLSLVWASADFSSCRCQTWASEGLPGMIWRTSSLHLQLPVMSRRCSETQGGPNHIQEAFWRVGEVYVTFREPGIISRGGYCRNTTFPCRFHHLWILVSMEDPETDPAQILRAHRISSAGFDDDDHFLHIIIIIKSPWRSTVGPQYLCGISCRWWWWWWFEGSETDGVMFVTAS